MGEPPNRHFALASTRDMRAVKLSKLKHPLGGIAPPAGVLMRLHKSGQPSIKADIFFDNTHKFEQPALVGLGKALEKRTVDIEHRDDLSVLMYR